MSDTPWTPGPWVMSPDPDFNDATAITGDGWDIATAWGCYLKADADARLIAEAPAMAEVLADALDAWERHQNSGDMMQGDWVPEARAALAKARGQ